MSGNKNTEKELAKEKKEEVKGRIPLNTSILRAGHKP